MKTTRIALLALLCAGAFAGAKPAAAVVSAGLHIGPSGHARVDVGVFYDDLAPYGNWVERPSYGWVWHPRITRAGWRPYQYGHWAWTDYGWTWVSDEPYGWATYHYGRWYDDPNDGWEWVPGDEWAPSYVSWQEGDNYIGWAPLPPSVSISTGFLNVSLAPVDYLFVPEARFLDARAYAYAVPRGDCERIFRQTRNWTNYRHEGGRIFAAGVPVDRVQRAIGRNVPRYQVADLGWNQRHQNRFSGNRLAMFRPQVERGAHVAPPTARPLARNSVVRSNQVRQGQQVRQTVAQNQARVNRQQQALIGRQQVQNQARFNRQQQVQHERQVRQTVAQNQVRVNRQQQQVQHERQMRETVVRNQERFNRQQVHQQQVHQQQVAHQQQVVHRQQVVHQQQVHEARQFRPQARQQMQPRQQFRQQQVHVQQQARPQQARVNPNRGGGRPQGNNNNRHGRNGNG